MKPPGFLQEKPLFSGDSWLISEQMANSGYFSALWMSALRRLVQLLRVANENQIRAGVGYGQDIGQRHLRRFVHEQYVDSILRLGPGPQPGGSGGNLTGAAEFLKHLPVVFRQRHARWRFSVGIAGYFAHSAQVEVPFPGCQHHLVQQIDADLVAVGGDSNPAALLDQFANHPSGSVRLSGTGRSLYGQDAKAGRARDAEGRIQRAIALPANGIIPEVRSLAL